MSKKIKFTITLSERTLRALDAEGRTVEELKDDLVTSCREVLDEVTAGEEDDDA